jgi:hypothetical protein
VRRRRRSGSTAVVARRSVRRRGRRRSGGGLSRGVSGVVPMLIQGVKDAGVVTAGKATANIVGRLIPMPIQGTVGRVLSATIGAAAVGFAAQKFLGRDLARFAVAGALQAPIEGFVKAANVPYVSAALGDDVLGDYYTGVGDYSGGSLPSGVGDYSGGNAGVGDSMEADYY